MALAGAGAFVLALAGFAWSPAALDAFDLSQFDSHRAFATMPSDPRDASERVGVPDSGSLLAGYVVRTSERPRAALFILHGLEDTATGWSGVQHMLRKHGITSFVFDYSGFGESAGRGTIPNITASSLDAYRYFTAQVAGTAPAYVLAYSLGSGPALAMDDAARTLRRARARGRIATLRRAHASAQQARLSLDQRVPVQPVAASAR
ncbi:MAG: alpha/beta hydrolase [Candidatus Eremiobacteraeota bacterium]|nr:alpha/beta hydrolase [Candidatus Eremiobacteraeota bacterium]